jgi:hypothetical protein
MGASRKYYCNGLIVLNSDAVGDFYYIILIVIRCNTWLNCNQTFTLQEVKTYRWTRNALRLEKRWHMARDIAMLGSLSLTYPRLPRPPQLCGPMLPCPLSLYVVVHLAEKIKMVRGNILPAGNSWGSTHAFLYSCILMLQSCGIGRWYCYYPYANF